MTNEQFGVYWDALFDWKEGKIFPLLFKYLNPKTFILPFVIPGNLHQCPPFQPHQGTPNLREFFPFHSGVLHHLPHFLILFLLCDLPFLPIKKINWGRKSIPIRSSPLCRF